MRPGLRRTLIAAVVVMAFVGAMALLPRSGHAGASIAVRGAMSGPPGALDMSGGATSDTTDTTVGTPTSVTDTTVPATATSTTRPTPRTTPSTAPSPSTTVPRGSTTTVPQVAAGGPATGRLAVTLITPATGALPSAARAIATTAADGSDERVLAIGNYIDPRWSPDGRYVLFGSSDAFASWAVPAAGGPVTRLGDGAVAVVSPDGTRIINVMAVLYATGPPQLTVQPIAETAAGLVTVGPATPLGVSGVGPVWSPDGRRILYNTEMGGSSGLAIVNADGTGRHDLPVKAFGMDHPGFSADGSTISFLGTDSTVYFIGADGQGLRPALPSAIPGVPSLGAFVTNWSWDHQHLAVLINGGNTVVVTDMSGHVVANAHLTVGAMPIGVALDGSGQYAYYMGMVGTFPNMTTSLYSIALNGGTSQRVGSDASASFPLSVLAT